MIEQADEVAELQNTLEEDGLHAALAFLNGRTPFRFTGVYRFDGEMLRNVCLFDRWSPGDIQGADAPMAETFCAIVRRARDDALEVDDGRSDERFPWMANNAVVSYCGALLRDSEGRPYGTLCHFDVQHCEPSRHELSLLKEAAPLVYRFLSDAAPPSGVDAQRL
jgi:hypothetical protein